MNFFAKKTRQTSIEVFMYILYKIFDSSQQYERISTSIENGAWNYLYLNRIPQSFHFVFSRNSQSKSPTKDIMMIYLYLIYVTVSSYSFILNIRITKVEKGQYGGDLLPVLILMLQYLRHSMYWYILWMKYLNPEGILINKSFCT